MKIIHFALRVIRRIGRIDVLRKTFLYLFDIVTRCQLFLDKVFVNDSARSRTIIGSNYLILRNYRYYEAGLLSFHNCDFVDEEKFREAYQITHSLWPMDCRWKAYICCWAACRAKQLEGDFVECGVWRAGTASLITKYIDFNQTDKIFYLMDTFEGMPDQRTEEEKNVGIIVKNYEDTYMQVKNLFKEYKNVELIKGTIPETLSLVKSEKISLLHIDMNQLYPEIEALNHFWNRIVSGGIIILDDYGLEMRINQKLAFDEFAESKGVFLLPLPTAQAIMIKD